jgi:hypothetical protein
MSPQIPATCPHEHRPGVTVCLHCRHDALSAARTRTRRLMARLGLVAGGVAAVIGIGVAGAGALEGRPSTTRPAGTPGAAPRSTRPVEAPTVESSSAGTVAATPAAVAAATPVAAPAPAPAPAAALVAAPADAQRTDLGEPGVYAVRSGDTVTVYFDTPMTRTRRPEKFERIVRTTLPRVYGAESAAAAAVLALPEGQLLASGGDLLTELPSRGIELPAGDGRALMLWPATRPGQDGPLVVSYRVVIK